MSRSLDPKLFDPLSTVVKLSEGRYLLAIPLTRCAILASRDTVMVKSGWAIQAGDILEIDGTAVQVLDCHHVSGWGQYNWACEVGGDNVAALREKLTYRLDSEDE